MSLYTKILLFFITLVVLLSVVTTYSGIHSIERIAVNELEKGLTSDINLFSFSVDSEFYRMETRMRLVAIRKPLRDAIARRDVGRIRAIFTDLLQRENIDALHLVDDRNRPIVTLQNRHTDPPVTLPLPASGATTRGFVTVDRRDGVRPAIFLSMPIEELKVVLSEIVVLDNANHLVRNLSDLLSRKRGEPVYISLFRDDRRMFSTIFSLTGTDTQDLPEEITATLHQGDRTYIGRTTIGRSRYHTIYKPSPYNDEGSGKWAYGIAVSENIFLPFKKHLLFVFVMISVLATSAVIVITFVITRGIDPSLRGILAICGRIEEGDTLSRIDTTKVTTREFTLIASSINRMLDSISERERTISDNMERIRAINAELEEKTNTIRQDRIRFLSILETVDEGVVALNHDGVIIYYNRAAAAITGTDPVAAPGETWKTLFPSLDISCDDGHTVLQEVVIPREGSAEPVYLKVLVSPWSLESAPQGRILLLQDISREKRMEEFKADFVSAVNHDIRSFLVPVSAFLDRILGGKYGPLEGAVSERLLNVSDNISKIHHLVENYLNVSRIESGKLDLAIGPVDMNEIIRGVAKLYGHRVACADGAAPQALVLADRDYIERVITNLVVNALKFSPEDSMVRIGVRVEGATLVTFVEDSGVGIPAEELPFIFEKYRRGSLGRREEGSGLGLFIVKSVVEGHGGSIGVESTPGRGSMFFFSLPLFKGEI